MSFEPFQYVYTPPVTVPAPLRVLPVAVTSQNSQKSQTLAGQLISRLNDIGITAAYLQTIVLNRCAGSGVTFAAGENPDLAAALGRIYQTTDPIPGISIEMYNNMLDSELALMQMDAALGNDADREASPYQVADLMTATKAFEDGVTSSLDYASNLSMFLRTLKGDQLICQNLAEDIADYPAYRGTTSTLTAGLDLSPTANQLFNDYLDSVSNNYSRTFCLMTTPGHVEADIANIADKFFNDPIQDLMKVGTALSALQTLTHGVSLSALGSDLTNFMFVRMLSEVGSIFNQMDRMFNLAVAPLKVSVGQVAGLARMAQSVGSKVGFVASGGLKGMVSGNPCSGSGSNPSANASSQGTITANPLALNTPGTSIENAWNQVCGPITSGVASLASHLNWATNTVDQKNQLIQDSLRKLQNRRIGDTNDRIQLMCSLQAVTSLIGIAKAFVQERQTSPTPVTSQDQLESMGRILNNLTSPSGSSYAIQNGSVVVTPPTVPPVPDSAETVFNAGGANRVTTSDILQVQIGAPSAT
jgi:hypothetical protein